MNNESVRAVGRSRSRSERISNRRKTGVRQDQRLQLSEDRNDLSFLALFIIVLMFLLEVQELWSSRSLPETA
jgi:hypothetical protein